MRAILFGAGSALNELYKEICKSYEVICFTDNDTQKWGTKEKVSGKLIYEPAECFKRYEYDAVIITTYVGCYSICQQCLELGVPEHKIITSFVEFPLKARIVFLSEAASLLCEYEQEASVAEAGVFEGEFAKWINYYFPNRKLYLFDTFQGFDIRDVEVETKNSFSYAKKGDLGMTSVDLVMSKMSYPELCRVYAGYFPDSAKGINDRFCFVNLDMDLYEPTYNGLCFFQDKMTDKGIILVHDYYSKQYTGVKPAVDRFIALCGNHICRYPIGDGSSIMLVGSFEKLR